MNCGISPHGLLMRGKLETLLARREIGLLFIAFAMHHPRDRARFEAFAQRIVDMEYSEARRHMQLAANWERCVATLERLQNEAVRSQRPFVVPGLRRLLVLAGIVGAREKLAIAIPPMELPRPAALPNDVRELQRMVRRLQGIEREFRARVVVLRGERDHARSRVRHLRAETASLRRQIRQLPKSVDCTLKATPHEGAAATALCCCATLTAVCAIRCVSSDAARNAD